MGIHPFFFGGFASNVVILHHFGGFASNVVILHHFGVFPNGWVYLNFGVFPNGWVYLNLVVLPQFGGITPIWWFLLNLVDLHPFWCFLPLNLAEIPQFWCFFTSKFGRNTSFLRYLALFGQMAKYTRMSKIHQKRTHFWPKLAKTGQKSGSMAPISDPRSNGTDRNTNTILLSGHPCISVRGCRF